MPMPRTRKTFRKYEAMLALNTLEQELGERKEFRAIRDYILSNGRGGTAPTPWQIERLKEVAADPGMSLEAMADEVEVNSTQLVRRWIGDFGIKWARGRPGKKKGYKHA